MFVWLDALFRSYWLIPCVMQVLSREDVQQALRHALKLQAGRQAVTSTGAETSTAAADGADNSAADDGNPSQRRLSMLEESILRAMPSAGASENAGTGAGAGAKAINQGTGWNADRSDHTPTSPSVKQIVLSQWALDTAFSAALKVPTPRLGRPAARPKDEIAALVTDKHEKSLIGNVISPQDIGVTYDMIGEDTLLLLC